MRLSWASALGSGWTCRLICREIGSVSELCQLSLCAAQVAQLQHHHVQLRQETLAAKAEQQELLVGPLLACNLY